MKNQRFAMLALAAMFTAAGCGRGDEVPLCGEDVCVTSSSSELVQARFDLGGTTGTARLEVTDRAIDVEIVAGDRVLMSAVAARGPSVGHEFLTAKRHHPVATAPGLDTESTFIHEVHGGLLIA